METNFKKLFKTLSVATILSVGVFLPMVPVLIKQFLISSKGTWVQQPLNSEYLNQLWWFLNSKFAFNITLIILLVGIIYNLFIKSSNKISREIAILFLWWFVPFTFMFWISKKEPIFIDRYILFNTVGLYLFIAVAINIIYNRIQLYILSLVLLIVLYSQLQINSKDFYYREVQNMVRNVKGKMNNKSIVLIYPYCADLGFMYYFNNNIFEDFDNYDSLLYKNNIFHVWNFGEAKEKLEKSKSMRIIYVQDGQLGDNKIFNYLDSAYIRIDSTFYPQCFNVCVFESMVKDSVILKSVIQN